MSDRCSTFKLLKNDLNTKRSLALNKKSASKPDKCTLTKSKSESQMRRFKSDNLALWENFTEPGGTGTSGMFDFIALMNLAGIALKIASSFCDICFLILKQVLAHLHNSLHFFGVLKSCLLFVDVSRIFNNSVHSFLVQYHVQGAEIRN